MPLPDAARRHPLIMPDGTVHTQMVHLARAIDHPNISVGDWTYAHDFDPPADWAARLAPWLYPGAPERLEIGRFCQIAHGVRFVTASANHDMTGFSTYPFGIFDSQSQEEMRGDTAAAADTVIGNDVWIGSGAMVLPGVRVGSGAILGAGAVVARDVPAYAVAAGNPARVVRMRFGPEVAARLLALSWWDWPEAAIRAAEGAIRGGDLAALEAAGKSLRALD